MYYAYVYQSSPGTFNAAGLRAALFSAIGTRPSVLVDIGGMKAVVIFPDTVSADVINNRMSQIAPGVGFVNGIQIIDEIAQWVDWRNDVIDYVDNVLNSLASMLTEAGTDYAGWDAMTTSQKIEATKRMLNRHIYELNLIRKMVLFMRYM